MLSSPTWFDAHLDLASLVEGGRDMHVAPERAGGDLQPAAVTLPSLAEGNVRACLGTIFTKAITDPADQDASAYAYTFGDAEGAHRAGVRQLKLYQAWRDAGVIELMSRRGEAAPPPSCLRASVPSCLLLGILMECADPITAPDELGWWVEQGVIAIGMAWWHGSRYAGGNGVEGGLTDLGRELIRRMDELGVVHDASHLSDRALAELFELTDAPVIASHSNCRALLAKGGSAAPAIGGTRAVGGAPPHIAMQRHLSDETIREIARRGGVIGLNLVRNFIRAGLRRDDPTDRPSVEEAIAHVEHVCEVAGDRRHVGLGSDMDGGITANDLPRGIERPADLVKLAEVLSGRGWSDEEVVAFASGNWGRFWGIKSSDA